MIRVFPVCFFDKHKHCVYSKLKNIVFVAVFLGCTSTGRVGLYFLWFFVQELPKAQPAVVLVLKRLRRRGNGLKSHPTDWEKPGIAKKICYWSLIFMKFGKYILNIYMDSFYVEMVS